MKTKTIALMGVVAALYVAMTVLVAPIGFGMFQFRIAELLKPLVLKGKWYVLALVVGLFIANLFSPSIGAMELAFMPVVCAIGGIFAYDLRKKPIIATTFYAVIISFGVAITLLVAVNAPFWLTLASVGVSELILMHIGRIVIDYIFRNTKIED